MVVAPASDHASGLDFGDLAHLLEEQIDIEVMIRLCDSYQQAIVELTNGSAQLGWLGPYAYMEALKQGAPIEAFAVELPEGNNIPSYHSVFITPITGSVKTLDDIRGCRIAVSDPYSTSGYLIPRSILLEYNLDLENGSGLKDVVNVHDHDVAIQQLIAGEVEVAAVSSINLQEHFNNDVLKPDQIQIVHRSEAIPAACLVYSSNLPETRKQQIKNLVLDAHNHIRVSGYGGEIQRYIDPVEARQLYLASHLRPQWGWRSVAGVFSLACFVLFAMVDLEINPLQLLIDAARYLPDILGRMLPPDFSHFGRLMRSLLETVEIAFLGTILAILISIPIGLLSARNIAPNYFLFLVARTITVFFRAIPEFIMAMILVIAIGFGAIPGVLALGFHTMGFLAKFYAEAIEHVDTGPVEALEATGGSRLQVVMFAIVPQIIPSFVANNLYIFDRNIRMATMLGIVGAGGIGYELQSSFRMFEYPRVSAIILVIFAAIFIIDMASSFLRHKINH